MIGASPSDSSSARSTFGSRPRARASDSICCSPPEQQPGAAAHDPLEGREVATRDLLGETPASFRLLATDMSMITDRSSVT